MNNITHHHTLVVLVENKAGVLARVAGLFARRGFNIESLAVAPTDDERFSRITIVVDAATAPLEQIIKQLNKLINVVEDQRARRQRVGAPRADARDRVRLGGRAQQVIELVDVFQGKILGVGHAAMTVSLERPSRSHRRLRGAVRPFGIVELQRTGRVALPRLDHSGPRLRAVNGGA